MRGTEHWTKPNRRLNWRIVLGVYVLLLACSHVVYALWPDLLNAAPRPDPDGVVAMPEMTADGPVAGSTVEVAYQAWRSGDPAAPLVLLIHGSPGDATNFDKLGPALAQRGVDSIAIDLPGFGGSTPWVQDYGARSMARVCLSLLDELHGSGHAPQRVHALGWSNGGAVVLEMSRLQAQHGVELGTLTMLLATGAQRTEGSGDYLFEKAKYALGYAAVFASVELLPHFGMVGPRSFWYAFIANFMHTDQRPLVDVLGALETPLLILHGRGDFLVAPWAAEMHHRMAPDSTLVMLEGDHFMPFTHPGLVADHVAAFIDAHEDPASSAARSAVRLKPPEPRGPVMAAFDHALTWLRSRHWALEVLVVALLALAWWRVGLVLAAVLVAGMYVDYGVASVGLAVAIAIRGPAPWQRVLCVFVGIVALFPAWVLVRFGGWWAVEAHGAFALVVVIALVSPLTWVLPRVWTRSNRQRIRAQVWRWISHEFWPTWISHVLLAPTHITQTLRYKRPVIFTATNPGIAGAGGFVGERKSTLSGSLQAAGAPLLPTILLRVHSDDQRRLARAKRILQQHPELGGYPVVLKPDRGERGAAVRVCRSDADVLEQITRVRSDMVMQKFEPAPHEVGLFWVRLRPPGEADEQGREGKIFSVTRKIFPQIVGDGRRTLRQLVLNDDRFRVQEPVFARRFGAAIDRVPPAGERVKMGMTGNHSQGCRFEDGAHLITEALTDAIDGICRRFPDADGSPGGLDIGRFDIRYADEDELKAGRGFSVIELNGSSAEATNVYDPTRTWWWAIEVMSKQWGHAYRLGAMRRSMGREPVGLVALIAMAVRESRRRPEETIAD